MKLNEMFPSRWLKVDDIPDDGELVLTISGVTKESVGQGEEAETKAVVWFKETDKGLVLNKTNGTTIGDIYGDDTEKWNGQRITLFSTEVEFRGKVALAIRIRLKKPKAAPQGELVGAGAGKGSRPALDPDED